MAESSTALTLRYMQNRDLPQVLAIDMASFNPPWPERSYRFEINESMVSYMAVLEQLIERPPNGIRRLLSSLRRDEAAAEQQSLIVGYCGLWKIAEEAHISTIASHPDHRGQRYGEILLMAMLRRAVRLQAEYVVLEVRVSNAIAQKLYHKHGFEVRGVKKGYYHHDQEDAYDMRLDLDEQRVTIIRNSYATLLQRLGFEDFYATAPHPRIGR